MENKKRFGVMLDVSRNAVMKPEKVKEYAKILADMGYNMLQLYTEDTYEVEGEPYFGYLRGAYTKEELKDIDTYCAEIGIEVIPCIQTLAHLNCMFKWSEYNSVNDTDDILLVGEDRTYALIENMFKTLAECFTSRTVNLGMDEAHAMGLGKYLKKHGYTDRFSLFIEHLEKVIAIAEKYGFKPVIWSDMLLRLLSDGGYNAEESKVSAAKDMVPHNVGLIYWEYFYYKKEDYEKMISLHKKFGNKVWYAGAVHTYIGYCTSNLLSDDTLRPAMEAVKSQDIDNVLITLWGGDECSFFLALPSLCYARCCYEGITDREEIKKRFAAATGESYDSIYGLDAANTAFKHYFDLPEVDFSKYVLFSDLFSGYQDVTFTKGATEGFLALAEKIWYEKKGSGYEYLFDTQIALLKTLYYKHDLGMLLRRAYADKDIRGLSELHGRILCAVKCAEEFCSAFLRQWHTENKPQGCEVPEIKFGGLIKRWTCCAERLKDFIDGKTESLPELAAPLLPYKAASGYMLWRNIVSVNTIV